MVIVTGLGRCGTSLVMKLFEQLGYNLGYNISWIDEINAGLELSPLHRINSEMYFYYILQGKEIDLDASVTFKYWKGKTYREVIQTFDKDPVQGDFIYFIKDPRLTWDKKMIRAWWECRKDLKFLFLHRDIDYIIKSRKSLPSRFEDPKAERKNPDCYKIDFYESITEILSLNIPYQLIFYPNFCYKPEILFNALENLCNNFKLEKEEIIVCWNEIFDPNKIHQEL